MEETVRQRLDSLHYQLTQERASFEAHWRELSDFILPRRSRWYTSDVNKGDRRNQKIYDNTATIATRDLSSMLMAGDTSPARRWFNVTVPDQRLAEQEAVKAWCYDLGEVMASLFVKGNLYATLPVIYEDAETFAVGMMTAEEDFDDVVRFKEYPIGSYHIAQDWKGRVNTFDRDFQLTVRQIVNEYARNDDNTIDWSKVSDTVKSAYTKGQFETRVDIRHIIAPNENFKPKSANPKDKLFLSYTYETGSNNRPQGRDRFLRESGYGYNPLVCFRWDVAGEDIYGTNCPGMTALGDTKGLQILHKRLAQALEKQVNPPLNAPAGLKSRQVTQLPGGINYFDLITGGQGITPLLQVNPDVKGILFAISEHQRRIKEAYHINVIMSLLNPAMDKDMTAREIEERSQEKYYVLGRLMERSKRDVKDPIIDITFRLMERQGFFAKGGVLEPPEAMQGQPLKVEYTSVMAQAAKSVALAGQERFMSFVGNLLLQTKDMTVVDKVDLDQAIDEYGLASGIPPRIIRSDDQVAQMRQARAKLQAQQQQVEQAQVAARAAKDLSAVDMEKDSAFKRLAEVASNGGLPSEGENQ